MMNPSGPHIGLELLAPGDDGICVARVSGADGAAARFSAGDLVLAPAPIEGSSELHVSPTSCIALPAAFPLDRALAVPPLALALWIWDAAGLEPGEVAVYASDAGLDRPLAIVAGWRSARDVIRLTTGDAECPPLSGVVSLSVIEPETAGTFLSAAMRAAPGAAAAILTGRTDALDLILEAIPMWGRIVLAARATSHATIDFYNNVHRKGCRMLSVPGSPAEMLTAVWNDGAESYAARAVRILRNERLAAACLA